MLFDGQLLELALPLELPDLEALDPGDLTPDLRPLAHLAREWAQEGPLALNFPALHPLRAHD
jgi:hypothetical protein